ncbi:MAG: hypothetical protein HY805_10770 [Nitrospirae bacterium]|nr:hypothetical protein [Nitrospirota bacterium]
MKLRLISLLVIVFIGTNALSDEKIRLREENLFLKAELVLAKKSEIYFIFDLNEKKIYLKARGAVFKEWQVEGMKLWGSPPPIKPLSVLKKSTFIKPKRERIKPKSQTDTDTQQSDTFEVEALELRDMPLRYNLHISDGVLISVRPKTEGLVSGIMNICHTLKWYTSRPLLTVWNTLWRKPFVAVDLILSDVDAQALYWAVSEGSGSIIYYWTTDD